ncbi:hypothetical protein FACS18948_7260 [Clostridia bacterium]|nr:hypothetical protein FACS18948_7260 [Clostridia bacterium]
MRSMKRFSRWIKIIALALAILLTLSGCSVFGDKADTPEDVAVDAPVVTLAPTPSPTPTHKLEPTVTPRPIDMPIETPQPGATALAIDPIDKPHRTFKYEPYESQSLGINFNIPQGWTELKQDESGETIAFLEPEADALDGFPAILWVSVLHQSANLVREDAKDRIDIAVESLKEEFPGISISNVGDNNKMLNETGYYYNYRIANVSGYPVRGRIFTIAINRMMIQIELRCPGNYNNDYMDIFREVRNSAKIYGEE